MRWLYISYSKSDRAIADQVCTALEAAGMRCRIIPRDAVRGVELDAAVDENIDRSQGLVVILSAEANRSERVQREVARAARRHLPILPIRIEDVSPSGAIAEFLDPIVWFDARTRPLERHFSHLVDAARGLVGYRSADRIEAVPAPPPLAQATARVDRRILALVLLVAISAFLSFLAWTYRNVDDSTVASLVSRSREASLMQPPRITANLDIADVDVFFPGADLPETPIAITTSDACRQRCAERADCAAFSYVRSDHLCYLKSAANSQVARPGTISGRTARGPL
jgi:hypothetical protein